MSVEEAKKHQINPLNDLLEKEANYLKILRDLEKV